MHRPQLRMNLFFQLCTDHFLTAHELISQLCTMYIAEEEEATTHGY